MLLRQLLELDWTGLKAMPVQTRRNVLLDIVFSTEQANIRLTGKAHVLPDGVDEAFSLAIYQHRDEKWWTDAAPGAQEWTPRDLHSELGRSGFVDMMDAPRDVHFYTNARLRSRAHADVALLDGCCGIRFSKVFNDGLRWLLVVASNDYPCTLEVYFGENEHQLGTEFEMLEIEL